MKIVFMGTPDFAVPCLKALIEDGNEIAGVFTQPDKPKGRGYHLIPPPVKECALSHNIEVFQPVSMKDGWGLRFTNLPSGSTYEFVEGTADGFKLTKIENTGADDESFDSDVDERTATGTIATGGRPWDRRCRATLSEK